MLQRALERRRVALEEVERVGAVHHQAGADITVAIDVELDVDAAELRRIESNLEMLVAGVGLRRDLDGEAGQRHGGGLRWGLRLRRDICGRCRRVGGRCEPKILHRVGAGLDRTAGVATLLRGCARFRLRQEIGYRSMEFAGSLVAGSLVAVAARLTVLDRIGQRNAGLRIGRSAGLCGGDGRFIALCLDRFWRCIGRNAGGGLHRRERLAFGSVVRGGGEGGGGGASGCATATTVAGGAVTASGSAVNGSVSVFTGASAEPARSPSLVVLSSSFVVLVPAVSRRSRP